MGADLVSENDPDPDHRDHGPNNGPDNGDTPFVGIPSPRPAPDNHMENLPKTGPPQPVWWYDQPRKRGNNLRYTGHVTRIGGAEGDRIRGELTAIIRDLLDWATQQADAESTPESRQDGDTDDNPT